MLYENNNKSWFLVLCLKFRLIITYNKYVLLGAKVVHIKAKAIKGLCWNNIYFALYENVTTINKNIQILISSIRYEASINNCKNS